MKSAIFFLGVCLSFNLCLAQQVPQHGDSLISHSLDSANQALQNEKSQTSSDSLRMVVLEQELNQVNAGDRTRKNALAQELKDLKATDSLRRINKQMRIAQLKKTTRGIAVINLADTLFYIYCKSGPLSVKERAAIISSRIQELEDDYFFEPDSLIVSKEDERVYIKYGDLVVMTVNEEDGIWMGKSPENLANEFAAVIRAAIAREQVEVSFGSMVKKLLKVLLIFAVVFVIIWAMRWLMVRMRGYLLNEGGKMLTRVKLGEKSILHSDQQIKVANFVYRSLFYILIILVVYLSLPFIFRVFPRTRSWADLLFGWIFSPIKHFIKAFINFLPNMFTIAVIVLFIFFLIRLLRFLSVQLENGSVVLKGFYSDWAKPTFNILRILLYAFMFVLIFPYLPGSHSPVFQGVSVFLGILFSLGSSSAISNMVAGLVITYMRPFKIGDRVRIGDVTGNVIEKSLLITRIRTIKNEEITVPNSTILNSHTINFSAESSSAGLILHTSVTIGYNAPWRVVHQLLIDAAMATTGVLKDKTPFVLQTSLDDFFVTYQLNAYTDQPTNQSAIYSGLHQNIQDLFNKAGVEIMSPHYRAQRDGNDSTIPPASK